MEKTLDAFKGGQSRAISILEKLLAFLQQGEDAGVPIAPDLKAKVRHAMESVVDGKLRIALIGGFSEGKTAIAAAWLEKLDKSSMKISHQESSNEVRIYDAGPVVLIDTPGLFGFKQQENAETGEIEKYKDITKKYVSEAHLVLYVMDSTNPVKASHKDDLLWLFRTLNLLPRTVFVLSRFDAVADVADEAEYLENLAVKRENVTQRLQESIALTADELADLSIVAVAANPFDLGVEHWLANAEEFRALSHIAALQQATAGKIERNGGAAAIVDEMRKSIIRDVISKELPVAIGNDEKIGREIDLLEGVSRQMQEQLDDAHGQIVDAKIRLRTFVTDYFASLIRRARGVGLEDFADFFESEVGSEGIVIATRLKNEFDRQSESVRLEIGRMAMSFEAEIDHFDAAMMALGRQGLGYLVKGNVINNKTILMARDGVVSVAKAVGVDLAKWLKFKPWGAVNLAKGINGALAALGVAMELWGSWKQFEREAAFRKAIDKMVDNFEQQRRDLLALIDDAEFESRCFASYADLKATADGVRENIRQGRQRQASFKAWRKEAETIDAEFRTL
jgi:hypothetical protein